MDLEEAKKLNLELLIDHHLHQWSFKFDFAKRRFGCCDEYTKTVSLSKHLVLINDPEVVKNVILHEIAHALVGNRHGHNQIWQNKAREIGCIYVNRYASENINRIIENIVAICGNCGKEFRKYRMSSKKESCGKCDKVYNEKYLLEFKRLPQV